MSKNIQVLLRLALVFIVIVIGNKVIVAQTLTGDWTGEVKSEKSPDKIQLSFERRTERGGRNQHGSSFNYSDLQGLSREQALSGGPVKFSLVREAGTIECEGSFTAGRGAGTFRFTANQQFASAMKSRGFDFEAEDSSRRHKQSVEERLFSAAMVNVTTALADDLLSANFGKLDTEDLFKAAIFKVDSKFMQEMKASGFPNLGMEELVKARIFKIDGAFVKHVVDMGFDKEPFESLVKMKIFKITPEFITEVRNEGFSKLDMEDLVKMKIFKIDSQFIRQARSEGVPMDVEKLVQKRIGVYGR